MNHTLTIIFGIEEPFTHLYTEWKESRGKEVMKENRKEKIFGKRFQGKKVIIS